ncbi:MAG TPA: DUF3858 domain-containing protein [Puia sp.]|nr:DUF3858 domain-containing protein [Puia sp.]
MNKVKLVLFCFCMVFMIQARAQEKTKYKFGEISKTDFNLTEEKFDSGASAIFIKDIGNSRFDGNDNGSFTLVYTRYMRVKILNKNGLDIGNFIIDLNRDLRNNEKLYSVKGSTFNLEGGVISETKLDVKSIFPEKYNQYHDRVKFSMPALKEGSVFDLEYVIKSPFDDHLRSWSFQGEYPRLWSEYVVTIPPPFHYMFKQQGDDHFDIKTAREVFTTFTIRQSNETSHGVDNSAYDVKTYSLQGSSGEFRWVKRNVPAINEENFITALKNYYSKVSFQLNYFQWQTMSYTGDRDNYLENWNSISKRLLQDENFGLSLNHVNTWMTDEMKSVIQGASSDEEKAKLIYANVCSNFRSTNSESHVETNVYSANLRDVYMKKEGSEAEVNLLLTAMLRHEGITADPLILSTRENGYASASYPLINEYNYVICMAKIGDKWIPLDASHPFVGFGQLPVRCYNGYGHTMNEEKPLAIMFSADSMSETSVTSVFITNDEKGKSSGNLKTTYGKSGSFDRRVDIKSSSPKAYETKIKTACGSDMLIENFGIDSLNKFQFPLSVHYDFTLKNISTGADILYLNPMLNEGYKVNPLNAAERLFPVEMPFKIDETYLLNMEIPAGYQVDELPKSTKVAYNDTEGLFEYLIQKVDNNIQMRVRLKFNKAFFPTEEYTDLRNFYAYVLKKESEQIVFKKMK